MKPPIYIANVNITIIKISNKVLFVEKGFKYFVGCKDDDDDKIWLLCIMLPKISGCGKCFDETKYMSFLIED